MSRELRLTTLQLTMACRNTADEYGLSALVILIIFCNLGEVNESSAKPADGILFTRNAASRQR